MNIKTGVTVKINKELLAGLESSIAKLADRRVLVGVPKETAARQGDPVNNAMLAYIHNVGDPAGNIPARPSFVPGVEAALPEIVDALRKAAEAAVKPNGSDQLDKRLASVGMIAVASIRQIIRSNIAPPLALATIKARIARRKSASWRAKRSAQVDANLAAGNAPGAGLFTALIDTGAWIQSITWVIRKKNSDKSIVVGK